MFDELIRNNTRFFIQRYNFIFINLTINLNQLVRMNYKCGNSLMTGFLPLLPILLYSIQLEEFEYLLFEYSDLILAVEATLEPGKCIQLKYQSAQLIAAPRAQLKGLRRSIKLRSCLVKGKIFADVDLMNMCTFILFIILLSYSSTKNALPVLILPRPNLLISLIKRGNCAKQEHLQKSTACANARMLSLRSQQERGKHYFICLKIAVYSKRQVTLIMIISFSLENRKAFLLKSQRNYRAPPEQQQLQQE